jgi:hypothetical protein
MCLYFVLGKQREIRLVLVLFFIFQVKCAEFCYSESCLFQYERYITPVRDETVRIIISLSISHKHVTLYCHV